MLWSNTNPVPGLILRVESGSWLRQKTQIQIALNFIYQRMTGGNSNLVTDNFVTDSLETENLVTDNLVTDYLVTNILVATIW